MSPHSTLAFIPDVLEFKRSLCSSDSLLHRELPGIRKSCGKRDILFRQGDQATHVYRIKEGAVALEQFLEDGRRQLVELILPGDFCGLSADGLYTATGVALRPTTFHASSIADIERQPLLAWDLVQQFQSQLCAAHHHVLAVGRMGALERVCSLLLHLTRHRPESANEIAMGKVSAAIHIPLTRGEMGDYLGLSLETVCRAMSDLERRGLIDIGRRHGDVIIHDLARLKMIVE